MTPYQFGIKMAVGPAAPGGAAVDPMAAERARRVAQIKADAAKVRAASGTPGAMGNGANGTHQWSGRVMPVGAATGTYTPPAGAAPPSRTAPVATKRMDGGTYSQQVGPGRQAVPGTGTFKSPTGTEPVNDSALPVTAPKLPKPSIRFGE